MIQQQDESRTLHEDFWLDSNLVKDLCGTSETDQITGAISIVSKCLVIQKSLININLGLTAIHKSA